VRESRNHPRGADMCIFADCFIARKPHKLTVVLGELQT
jgi:hypothetical protein